MELFLYAVLVFVIVDLLFIGFVFYKRKFGGLSDNDRQKFLNYWKSILEDNDHVHAVINADKLLDRLLEKKGYRGSLGQKLKKAGSLFNDLDGVWVAHKLRNRIAHDIDIQISTRESKRALNNYARAFKDLGLL